jgi:uncharacterized protein with HEPN domain
MPRRDVRMYLSDIVDACDAMAEHVGGCDEEGFRTRRLVRAAVEREFTIACEAVVQLLKLEPELHSRITDAKSISHFRNVLIHAYDLIDPARMWTILQEDVPTLRREAAELLAERDAV